MKFLAVTLIVALAISCTLADLTPEQQAKRNKVQDDCIIEAGTTIEAVRAARTGTIADEDKQAKYLICVFKKFHFLRDDGTFDADKFKSKIPEGIADRAKAEALVEECIGKTGATLEARVVAAFKCYVEKKTFNFI